MKRRNFLKIMLGAAVAATLPVTVKAKPVIKSFNLGKGDVSAVSLRRHRHNSWDYWALCKWHDENYAKGIVAVKKTDSGLLPRGTITQFNQTVPPEGWELAEEHWQTSITSQPKVRRAQRITNEMLSDMAKLLDEVDIPKKGRFYWDGEKAVSIDLPD